MSDPMKAIWAWLFVQLVLNVFLIVFSLSLLLAVAWENVAFREFLFARLHL